MKGRSLFAVGVLLIAVATALRLIGPANQFIDGFWLALQVGGSVVLVICILRYALHYVGSRIKARSHDPRPLQ